MTCTHRPDHDTNISVSAVAVANPSASTRSRPGSPSDNFPVTPASHSVQRLPVTVTRPHWPVVDAVIPLANVMLENGLSIDVSVHYRLEGTINEARDNVVLVVHALTGNANVSEWWTGVVGDGETLNPRTHAILCANLLGSGAGESITRDDTQARLPPFSTRDQAIVLARLLDALRIQRPALVCGGSLGGMVSLEFAASFPDRVNQVVVFAAPAVQTAQGLAWHAIMRRAIAVGGSGEGLALARMIGMISYRTPESLENRFGSDRESDGVPAVNSWLHAHGDRLVQRFDAGSYVCLLDAMDLHDVGRGRGGVAQALASVASRIVGVGIPGDILFTDESVRQWCAASGAEYRTLTSTHGHDAFLLETNHVSAILDEALQQAHDVAIGEPAIPSPALRVALAGCGHVGSAVLDLLREARVDALRHPAGVNSPHIQERALHPASTIVTQVLVRDGSCARQSLTAAAQVGVSDSVTPITEAHRLLDEDVDVLVEVIGGVTTARTLVESALRRGIRVVTANKALLAAHGPELLALALDNNTTLDFEGAVAAAVPVVRCLRSGTVGVGIQRITGVLNGTTNVVLQRVSDGECLSDAIRYAQDQGYAETDPTRDLSGQDAEDKLRVLAWLAFGVHPASLEVERRGIDEATASWAADVARDGGAVKLIATCYREGESIRARVAPERVALGSEWAQVSGAGNRIVIDSNSAGALVLQGPGAGGRATAGAVLSDIFTARARYPDPLLCHG